MERIRYIPPFGVVLLEASLLFTSTLPIPPHLITLPTPFPIGPVNACLLEGDPLTLVDCGPKHPDSPAALEAGLAAYSHRLQDIRHLILPYSLTPFISGYNPSHVFGRTAYAV